MPVDLMPVDIDSLYREHAAVITARLTRTFGAAHLDLVESAVQEAWLAALKTWPGRGVPDAPRAWLHTVARNAVLDSFRRASRHEGASEQLEQWTRESLSPETPDAHFATELEDDLLRMMFVLCHPSLELTSRVVLTLRTLCHLEVEEIGAALMMRPAAITKRLVRARKRLRDLGVTFDLPDEGALSARRDSVLAVLYLLFSEGYSSHAGARTVRADLCHEAIRLATLLLRPSTTGPPVHALLALMSLHGSRLDARVSANGELMTLEEQDRGRWDRRLIGVGLQHLVASSGGDAVTALHLEAGIAACHATAPCFESTDWARILSYYDQLRVLAPSPFVELNRAIAIRYARGPEAGLLALRALSRDPTLADYGLHAAALGEASSQLLRVDEARTAYTRALALVHTEPERRVLQRRLADLG
jgi:RNA polymerase sigma-70 factor, ECF subfamily